MYVSQINGTCQSIFLSLKLLIDDSFVSRNATIREREGESIRQTELKKEKKQNCEKEFKSILSGFLALMSASCTR